MKDTLHSYMSKRLGETDSGKIKSRPGPVVTISRTAGCSAQRISKRLVKKINKYQQKENWSLISKEVLKESAMALKIRPKKVKALFKIEDRSVLDDVVQAFVSKDYRMENKMRKTVVNVIHGFALDGNKVILGRAANIICADIEDALHVKIDAPLEWRIKKVMKSKAYSREQALKCLNSIETKRQHFRKSFRGKNVNSDDFDILINQKRCSIDYSVDLIFEALKLKGLI